MTSNRVRIVGGTWRSRLVRFEDRPGLRPTPDRVRETLFNWLGQDLTGRAALDLYAGSGALGFEAASRGAKHVVMVERDAASVRALKAACEALQARQVEVVRADALEFIQRARMQYDVIFLDPPFADAPWDMLFQRLPAHLANDGMVYCESGTPIRAPSGWAVHREGHAGQVSYALLKRTAHEPHRGIPGNV
ncbi:MAG: 16S rRNA (guanine(966)-N(2))-methyltransferase RsmD [Rhodospirillaceae bacterium]